VTYIVGYQKFIDALVTREIRMPVDSGGNAVGCELATIGGITYCSIPTGFAVPASQPAEIAASVATVALDAALRAAIKAASPHCQLVKARRKERILAAGYTPEDQLAFLHMASGAAAGLVVLTAEQAAALAAYVARCKKDDAWAASQYEALGL
jgi:hypothetical protein